MAKRDEVTVTVYWVEYYGTSSMGNPTYSFRTSNGEFRTMSNAGIAYGITNDFPLKTPVEMETTFSLTKAGRVTNYKLG